MVEMMMVTVKVMMIKVILVIMNPFNNCDDR